MKSSRAALIGLMLSPSLCAASYFEAENFSKASVIAGERIGPFPVNLVFSRRVFMPCELAHGD